MINLIDRNEEMCEQWNIYFKDCKHINIINGDILDHDADAIVSPGNSFGFMDGGLDLAISKKFGWHIQESL